MGKIPTYLTTITSKEGGWQQGEGGKAATAEEAIAFGGGCRSFLFL
jgi:hypothetical protein